MILTAKEIAEITRLLDDSRFSELRLEVGDFKLRVSRGGALRPSHDESDYDDGPFPAPVESAPQPALAAGPGAAKSGEADIPAPLLGNFYHAPRPGEVPFVKIGDQVTADTVIGIIEVMKLMNSVRAGIAGTVLSFLVDDGKAVEDGQPLLRVRLGD